VGGAIEDTLWQNNTFSPRDVHVLIVETMTMLCYRTTWNCLKLELKVANQLTVKEGG
jgi:hypothetical protein